MDGTTVRSSPVSLQRAYGRLAVSVKPRGTHSVLHELRQEGCLKARFPRPDDPAWLQVVTLNTSGGVAGGDVLDAAFAVGVGARATIASQAAERFYRALPGSAASRMTTRIVVAACGAVEWLPQDTILFDRCAVRRRLRVELAADAWFLGVESLVFGRAAMGERMSQGKFVDLWRMRRGGRMVFAENIHLDGDIGEKLARPAIAKGGTAIGAALIVPGDEALVARIRELSESFGGEVGISAWNGFAMARFCAQDAACLRADMMAVLGRASSSALPRLWLN